MNNIIVKYAAIAVAITLGTYLLFYFINSKLMVGPVTHWITLTAVIVCMLIAVRTDREILPANYPFKRGLTVAFRVFLINTVAFHIFYYVLFVFIDPGLVDLQMQVNQEWIIWMSEAMMGIPPDDPAYEQFENMDNTITIRNTFFGLSRNIIGGFIISLPIAAMYRRNFEQ